MQRSNIYNNYIKNPKWQEEILRLRKIADEKIMEHPLHSKVVRLNIILEAINEAFASRVDKVVFSRKTGREIARIEKKSIGLIPPLLAEAHRIIEGEKGPEITINNWRDIVETAHKTLKNG
jgi:hypothetical protein